MNRITIPLPFHICVDDVGWFCGNDDRTIGGPSRTAMPRFHTAKDYEAIQMLGDEIGMNISCAFILGEWDMKDTLSDIPHFSHFEKNWKNSIYRDKKEMERIVDIINASPRLDMALHGLYHGYYMNGVDNSDLSDYYYSIGGKLHVTPKSEIKQRLDSFFDIMNHHGIKKSVNHFIPPSFAFGEGDMTDILAEYGIYYVSTIFKILSWKNEAKKNAYIENGVAVIDRNNNQVPWNAVGADFDSLPEASGILGLHWPNFLHTDPERNNESVKKCAAYVKRCLESFDVAAAESISVCATQYLYNKLACVREDGEIDLSSVPQAGCVNDFFFINSEEELCTIEGAKAYVHKKFKNHITYKVVPSSKKLKVIFN